MEIYRYRSGIRFLFWEGKSCYEIEERLNAVYGNSYSSMATVKNFLKIRNCESQADCYTVNIIKA